MSYAYYNDNDARICAWLRELAACGLVAGGTVDSRSICDVQPEEVRRYDRVHLFAGIGGWDLACRLAGWPADVPLWTGSAPCQPFSSAGKQAGTADERHLWPEYLRLVRECRPAICVGEQVASRLGREWLAGVRADLEAVGYAVGAADLCAASVGAPHIRQRLYWVAVSDGGGLQERSQRDGDEIQDAANGSPCGPDPDGRGACGGVADAMFAGRSEPGHGRPCHSAAGEDRQAVEPVDVCGADDRNAWLNYIWLPCRDGKARRIEPWLAPLAHGVPSRVVRLRGYGNAIVPPLAATWLRVVMGELGITAYPNSLDEQ